MTSEIVLTKEQEELVINKAKEEIKRELTKERVVEIVENEWYINQLIFSLERSMHRHMKEINEIPVGNLSEIELKAVTIYKIVSRR